MTTNRQREANRANSTRSTGPRDTDRSRLNATRHGILSNETVILGGEGGENAELFEGLREGLHKSLTPVGELENLLVDELVLLTWRRRRVVRFETAAIRENTDRLLEKRHPQPRRNVSQTRETDHVDAEDALAEYIGIIQAVRDRPEPDDSVVVASWVPLFEFVDEEFDSPIETALELSGGWHEVLEFSNADVIKLIRVVVENAEIDLPDFWAKYEANLDSRIVELATRVASRAEATSYDLQVASLPSNPAMEKVQRYEAHLSRLFYRALNELQYLQGIRIKNTSIVVPDVDVENRGLGA
jgi:hypothetical protein